MRAQASFFFIGVLCFFVSDAERQDCGSHSFFADPDQAVLLNADPDPAA